MKWFLSILVALLCFVASASAGLKSYYLRHAQSGANVEREWEDVPWLLRPSYVGDAGVFSPFGEAQAAFIPKKLASYQFDFIAVSPMWRTRQTILGYLQKNHRQGEIWPELEEFDIEKPRAHELLAAGALPDARPDLFSGQEIDLPDEESAFFATREDGKKRFDLRSGVDERIEDCANALRSAIAQLRQRQSRGDQSILLVGHATSGALLLHMLVKNEGELPMIKNAHIWMAEEQPDGSFALKIYNDEPVGSAGFGK